MEFSLVWYMTIKTGSATILATSMLAALLPQIILGPFIGPYIDRWNRKRTMIFADIAISSVTAVLAVLFFFEAVQVWHIYVAMVLRAAGQAFHFPAMQASIPLIVPEKELTRAAGLNQILQGAILIAGPPAGALLLGLLPMQGVLATDIITAAIAVGCLLPLFIPQPKAALSSVKTSVLSELRQAFRYIWNWKGMTILIGLSAMLNLLLLPVYTLLPLLVINLLKGNVFQLGWLEMAFGVGTIGGGLLLGVWSGFKRRVATSLMGIIIAGVATFALAFTDAGRFWLCMGASFTVGIGLSLSNGPMMAALQSIVPQGMQGRIFSLLGSISAAATPLGLAVAGPVADAFGIASIYFVAGAAITVGAVLSFFIPALMNLEKEKAGQDSQAPQNPQP